jgi:hypothetical protein
MLILLGAALFAFGLLLFGVGVFVYLIGLILRVAIRLFQPVLLLVWEGVIICGRLRQRRKVTVLEGEILPPQPRALPNRRRVELLLLVGIMVLTGSMVHADDWRQRAKDAVAANTSEPAHQQCVLYADLADNKLHLRAPICFYNNGDIYSGSYDGYLAFNGRKAGATHPAVPCNETIEGIERVDPTTFLVRLYCKGATPERDAVSVQLVGDTISIRNTEAY